MKRHVFTVMTPSEYRVPYYFAFSEQWSAYCFEVVSTSLVVGDKAVITTVNNRIIAIDRSKLEPDGAHPTSFPDEKRKQDVQTRQPGIDAAHGVAFAFADIAENRAEETAANYNAAYGADANAYTSYEDMVRDAKMD